MHYTVETLYDYCFLVIIQHAILLICVGIKVKPLVEITLRGENFGHKEIKETPKLTDVIHQWGTCHQ